MTAPRIIEVLPPSEAFSPAAAGAIALMVARLFARSEAFAPLVLGPAPPAPAFPGVAFQPVRPAFRPLRRATRYAIGVQRAARALSPALIAVHNRPDIARFLAGRGAAPVLLCLQNDPQAMRASHTPAAREGLLRVLGGVIVASDFLRRRFLDGLSPDAAARVSVVPNCLDFAALPAPLPAAAREPEILYVGRVVADKGVDGFVAACADALPRLAGWRASIIGADRFGAASPETPFLRGIRERAAQAGITMHGYRTHDQVLAAMARAAIVAVPSRWDEPFGLTAIEAMASGAALMTTRRGALPDLAGAAALYIDPDDVAGMAQAIIALAGDPERRATLARAGLARARDFDCAAVLTTLDRLRREIVGRG
ncbi:MAG: glycosyltransferase family 4 protein [Acidibrevibacterium sp.]|jgi:glycosyltransferase involved in cell wall biosynthesis|uniref:glycosyltransferase family 4 protein n=1 Tax=Acidibrevibacterium fodinaquatile TaxID=1969806 RepID=UPI0023A8AE34|nr:glycosyltransferase family 4 protein [Acidibrevibacterium fodinaquatile]MCA7119065.1 glycosyltransferase family 4 protein [Acidibrevibacterium fodinaquatile]